MSIELSELSAEAVDLIHTQWNQQLDSLDSDGVKNLLPRIVTVYTL